MNDKDRLLWKLKRSLKSQIKSQTQFNKTEIGYLDEASWGYEKGILLTIREAQLILTLLNTPTPNEKDPV